MPTDPWQKLIQQWSTNSYACSEPFAAQELQNLTKVGWDLFSISQPPQEPTGGFAWWGGLFCETRDSKTYADWYVRWFCSKLDNSSQTPESRTTASLNWSESETLSNGLTKALLEELDDRLTPPNSIAEVPVRFRVLERSGDDLREVVVFVQLQPWKLASQLIDQAGSPPEFVIQDWQAQLKSFAIGQPESEISAAETLVAKDGRLLPLTHLLAEWAKKNSLSHSTCERDALSCAVDWPWKSSSYRGTQSTQIEQVEIQEQRKESIDWLSVSETTNLTSFKTNPASIGLTKNRKSSSKKVQAIAIVATGTLAMAALLWFLLPNKPNETPVDESIVASSQVRPSNAEKSRDKLTSENKSQIGALSASNSIAPASTDQELTQGVAELTTTPGMESMSPLEPTLPSSEFESPASITSLLSQFQPGQEQSTSLELLDSASVISGALSSSKNPTEASFNPADPSSASLMPDGMSTDPSQVNDDAIVPTEIESDTKDLPVVVDGTASIQQTIVVDAAVKKTVSSIGKPVIPKKCSCEFELKLNKDLIVEPTEVVTIEGEGKATWRIAIEDEEPELMLEIRSKPGNRWNHTILVGMRPSLNEPVVLIAPRDAQNVGNRLVQYIQWIDSSVLTLQTARANVRGRSPIDFVGEIRKLERQRREAEQAIERWKVVERLSHLFYNENQIQIKMSATIK